MSGDEPGPARTGNSPARAGDSPARGGDSPARGGDSPAPAKTSPAPAGDGAPPSFQIRVPAVCESLALTREAARRVAAAAGFDAVAAQEIAAAVDEAVTNVVQHAYRGEPGHEVLLRFRREERSLAIEVEHRGEPPGDLPAGMDLDRLAAERRRGGLGVHLMRRLMDTVEHRQPAPGVGRWLLVRNRPPAPGAPSTDAPAP